MVSPHILASALIILKLHGRARPKAGLLYQHIDAMIDSFQLAATHQSGKRLIDCGAVAQVQQAGRGDRGALGKGVGVFDDAPGQTGTGTGFLGHVLRIISPK